MLFYTLISSSVLCFNSFFVVSTVYCIFILPISPQRCTHKEVSGDYRNLASCLVSEILALIQLPAWPVAAILLEQLLLGVLRQLDLTTNSTSDNSANNNNNNSTSNKKDASYTPFLLDLLGSAAVGLRGVLVTCETEKAAARGFTLSSSVAASLGKKILSLQADWQAAARHQAEAEAEAQNNNSSSSSPGKPTLSGSGTSSGRKPPAKKGTKNSTSPENNKAGGAQPVQRHVMGIGAALEGLLEVTSSTIDAIADAPLQQQLQLQLQHTAAAEGTHVFNEADLDAEYCEEEEAQGSDFAALPSPLEILKLLPHQEEILG